MIQAYSTGVDVAAGGTIPFNNTIFSKGISAVQGGTSTFLLEKRGIYLVEVDGYGTTAAAGLFGFQLVVNGAARLDAITQTTSGAAAVSNGSFKALVVVPYSNCPNNYAATATTVQVINPVGNAAVTAGHYNIIISKLC